ncbi:MAG: DNA mismatch repair endonuclease MutL [Bryobacteraceae bacterium]|nr:DNA mismatch repair endonuclease MutL [Bryobacteraceae bacterium]
MGRIRILSDAVANKIAAGEVVERPASVVKELLENSLDAGAAYLRIEVEKGGRRLVRVTDDGAGMLRDDAMLAFERHATSKLSDVNDLFAIATLGFRGEALPSIAAVSRLLLETRSADETTGTRVEIAGGKLLRCDEAALARGTAITVRDLFFNVPARRKFLRSEQTELAHIASLATHYSLAHPGKSFELLHEGKSLLDVTPVESIRERVFQVFGSRTLSDLVELEPCETVLEAPAPGDAPGDAEVRRLRLIGFISQPQVHKLNRNSIYIFVNGRLIRDRLILHAISSAYHNVIPPACYPFALLFLECGFDEVDVNVHPSKTEVRFRHGSLVHDFVRDALRQELIASRPVSSLPPAAVARPASPRTPGALPAQAAAALPFSEFSQAIENHGFAEPVTEPPQTAAEPPPADEPEAIPDFTLRRPQAPAPRLDFGGASIPVSEPPAPTLKLKTPDTHGPLPPGLLPDETYSLNQLVHLRPLGQIHESFIVAAGRDGLWIVDQHVAHERILFEQVLRQQAAGRVERQQLLIPIVLELTAAQQVEYARIADELHASGFETEPFGHRAIAVKAAPAVAGAADLERLMFEILEIGESELRRLSMDDVRRAIAASIACRAAIKVNMRLDQAKMEWLLSALAKTECPMSCPHGRPIALRYATREILKGFLRI